MEETINRMLGIINLDEMFSNNPDAVLVNSIDFTETHFAEAVTNLVYTENKNEDIGYIAECECGNLKGNYYIGSKCPICKSIVDSQFVDSLKHKVWIGTPPGITAFMHPVAYMILSDWLKKSNESYLDIMLDVDAIIPEELSDVILGQGFNYVKENFDYLMDYFLHVHYKTRTKKQVNYIKWFLNEYRDRIWCTKLPILSNELHPIHKEGRSLTYADSSSKDILSAIIDLVTIPFTLRTVVTHPTKLEQVTFGAYKSYVIYLTKIIREKLASKEGLIRKHIFGTRLHGTFRSVIIPIIGPQQADEIHIPWKIGVNTYKLMIMNILINRHGYEVIDALAKVTKALVVYDPDIDKIFKTLIEEAAYVDENGQQVDLLGLPVLLQRNPSLVHQSIQLVFVTKVKRDITDTTIAISSAIVKGPNADGHLHR
jgi:hypothetical protein